MKYENKKLKEYIRKADEEQNYRDGLFDIERGYFNYNNYRSDKLVIQHCNFNMECILDILEENDINEFIFLEGSSGLQRYLIQILNRNWKVVKGVEVEREFCGFRNRIIKESGLLISH